MSQSAAPSAEADGRTKAAPRGVGRWSERNSVQLYALALMAIFALIVFAPRIFITVPSGHIGVHWLRFFGGTVTTYYFDEGVHMIFPWDEVVLYDARLQNSARLYDTISSDGLSMQVEIAVRFRLNRDAVGQLHRLVGSNYAEVLVYPEIGSHARALISTYTPEQLYTGARSFIQAQILDRMIRELGSSLANQSVGGRLVEVEDVLIRSVKLPPSIANAIERKVEQYQVMLEYDFRIEREKKERDRKRIEAEGVRDFQNTVSRTITDEYLRLRGIEATMSLATSANSKMIIIGGRDGLPVILNTEGTGAAASAPAAPAVPQPPQGSLSLSPPNAAPAAGDNMHRPSDPVERANAAAPPSSGLRTRTTPTDAPSADDQGRSIRDATAEPDHMAVRPEVGQTRRD